MNEYDTNDVKLVHTTSDVTVELVNYMARDSDVAQAARVSTIGGSHGEVADLERDAGLINFLMRDRHGSPFEHNSMTFFISAPIFVFREFHRHRVGWSYNEESGRYKELEEQFYVPAKGRPLMQKGKPGAYHYVEGTGVQHRVVGDETAVAYAQCWKAYQNMLRAGVAREVARMVLPVGIFSSMYATCNARSLMHFLSLRTQDPRARVPSFPQWEIKMVAERMEWEWAKLMPITYRAFNQHGRLAP